MRDVPVDNVRFKEGTLFFLLVVGTYTYNP